MVQSHDADLRSSDTSGTDDRLARLQQRLRESLDEFWDRYVDPADPLYDDDGLRWGAVGEGPRAGGIALHEQQLRRIRDECRLLATTNEFAINGHENRINFIVGSGHSYRASARPGQEKLAEQVQAVLDEFVRKNSWHKRQQEIVRRKDRDGECFLRLFPSPDGILRVRFIEPDQVAAPPPAAADPAASFGVVADPRDVETIRGYFVDSGWVDAGEIQHRKANVDANVKRGLPLFYPVRKNLRKGIRTSAPEAHPRSTFPPNLPALTAMTPSPSRTGSSRVSRRCFPPFGLSSGQRATAPNKTFPGCCSSPVCIEVGQQMLAGVTDGFPRDTLEFHRGYLL